MKNKKILLYDIDVMLFDDFPSCRTKCPHEKDCGNHRSADSWREKFGATPNLKQVVPGSWRCNKKPKERLHGAILVDGKDMASKNKPDWSDDGDSYDSFYNFSGPFFS